MGVASQMAPKPPRDSEDAIAREVDRLLKKLPGADPMLRGDPEPRTPMPHRARPQGAALGSVRAPSPVASAAPAVSPLAQRIGVWVRVSLGLALAVAVTQWPYARSCGFSLYFYVATIMVVLVAGMWAARWSWRLRMGVAHTASLVILFFGLALTAGQILPRAGYAADVATWGCP